MTNTEKSRSAITYVLLLFVLLAVSGVVGGGFFVKDYARARASLSWPSTQGVVLSDLKGNSKKVRYVYAFEGRSYQSTRERVFSAQFMKVAERVYTPGDAVTVYVNPADPSFSVLQPGGASIAFVVSCILSGVLIFIGVGGTIWTFSDGVEVITGDAVA